MDGFFIFCAQYLFIVPVLILGIYFLLQPRANWKHMAIFAISAALLAYLIAVIGGLLYYDPRPFVVGNFTSLIPHAPDNGFPSDHALLVSAIAMIGTIWNKRLGLALWFIALFVMAGRVYVGVHHPIDVIGSAVIAIGAVVAMKQVLSRATKIT
ncbi:MAG: phosphatase PAP2 family protein [Patescibacteria group bacterium]|nr:phosphatase PAP2 family protein [Patescibacteria group bacterium]